MKIPCISGCIQCGTCCVLLRISVFADKFYKPPYVKCPHLKYENGRTSCCLFDKTERPDYCKQFISRQLTRPLVIETRMKSFLHLDTIQHFVWLFENGFIEHFPVIEEIKQLLYRHPKRFFFIFICPYIRNVPGTLASQNNWFSLWRLQSYFKNMPIEYEIKLAELAKKTCARLYNNDIPEQILRLLSSVSKYSQGKWIKMLKTMMWGQ